MINAAFIKSETREFEIEKTGDPYNRTGWDVREKHGEDSWVFRGDLSPIRGRERAVALLKSYYPGCKVRVVR